MDNFFKTIELSTSINLNVIIISHSIKLICFTIYRQIIDK